MFPGSVYICSRWGDGFGVPRFQEGVQMSTKTTVIIGNRSLQNTFRRYLHGGYFLKGRSGGCPPESSSAEPVGWLACPPGTVLLDLD